MALVATTSGPLLEIYQSGTHNKVANLAIAGFAAYLAGIVALHVLHADDNPLRDMISDYATGSYAYVLTASFVALGLGCVALVAGLWRAVVRSAALTAGLTFLVIAAVAWFGSALFPPDPAGSPITRTGVIHTFDFIVSHTSMLLAFCLLSRAFRYDDRWKVFHRKAALLAIAYVMMYALMFYGLFAGSPFVGFSNRLLTFAMLAWLFAAAIRLRAVSTHMQ